MSIKIKICIWYLLKGVVLTNDNLARRNCNGSMRCFLLKNETIYHLFIDCHFARFIWRSVQNSFGLYPPHIISHNFENWFVGIDKKKQGTSSCRSMCCWALWLSWNDMVLTNHSLNLICRYFSRQRIGSGFGHNYKCVMRTTNLCILHAVP